MERLLVSAFWALREILSGKSHIRSDLAEDHDELWAQQKKEGGRRAPLRAVAKKVIIMVSLRLGFGCHVAGERAVPSLSPALAWLLPAAPLLSDVCIDCSAKRWPSVLAGVSGGRRKVRRRGSAGGGFASDLQRL